VKVRRKHNWPDRGPYNLFENFYRFGSLVFGGGDVLIPMMYQQYVVHPNTERIEEKNPGALKINKDDFLTGSGMVRAIPGPVFSIGAYMGGTAFKDTWLSNATFRLYHWVDCPFSTQLASCFILFSGMA
jgi:chromate transporter